MKFGIVGVLCFGIDYGLMIFLTEVGGIPYLVSSGISFSVSVMVNYILSLTFVFETDKNKNKNKIVEFLIFIMLSVIGLGINQILMWVCVDKLHVHYMISKIGVTGVVMLYNFITRKLILEKHNKE